MRGPGASALLGRALAASARHAGTSLAIDRDEAVPWHSATFTGARHVYQATAPAGAAAWLAAVDATTLPLPGHLLADLAVTRQREQAGILHLTIEALTVQA